MARIRRTRQRRAPSLAIPAAARAAAEDLQSRRGVVGVFWGAPFRKGCWDEDQTLVVHVRRKLPLKQLGAARIPARVGAKKQFRTDVIEVGGPSHHWLDPSDPVRCEDGERGRSAIAAIGQIGSTPYALLSGHGTLPTRNGQIVGDLGTTSMRVRAFDPNDVVFRGDLRRGRLDKTCDFALAEMDATSDEVNAYHYAVGQYPPHPVRGSALRLHEEVRQFSPMRGRLMIGCIRQISVGTVSIPGFGGYLYPYLDLVYVESTEPSLPFSVKGDSGSLVVDRQQRVIGMIVGGNPDTNLSYILPIAGAVAALGSASRAFFVKE